MTRYVLVRLVNGLFVLWAALTVSFLVLHLVPGDPVSVMLRGGGGEGAAIDGSLADELRADLGLDRPVHEQYLDFVWQVARLDFGTSFSTGDEVGAVLARALPSTLELAGASLLLALVLGVAAAVAATLLPNAPLRSAVLSATVVGNALPSFWTGIILLQVFSFGLGWFPAYGDGEFDQLVLPAFALALPGVGLLAQVLGRSLRTALAEPYVRTARAKGASRLRAVTVHALRNAAIPAMTLFGLMIGGIVAGAIVTETVFARQGIGRLTADAIGAHDFPVIRALVFLAGALYVLVNLAVDLIYPKVDPRIVLRSA
ncbi:ABC transporter permease [Streptomyces radicis]|uniref:ABC transporter permease n=1 Tax=Streptomyces radicis TaxID=1750517 RepID=A0A3A9W5D9_9ACTN|nr:ABC transporter permease [Streptomyces radicis]RKN08431.1 ABC transporter permease [Streptomyces radicis]RKN21659.1 ABC transporter permease [Streptomyces radicis]